MRLFIGYPYNVWKLLEQQRIPTLQPQNNETKNPQLPAQSYTDDYQSRIPTELQPIRERKTASGRDHYLVHKLTERELVYDNNQEFFNNGTYQNDKEIKIVLQDRNTVMPPHKTDHTETLHSNAIKKQKIGTAERWKVIKITH